MSKKIIKIWDLERIREDLRGLKISPISGEVIKEEAKASKIFSETLKTFSISDSNSREIGL